MAQKPKIYISQLIKGKGKMASVCFGGTENDITYTIYEEEGEYIATVNNHAEIKTEVFPGVAIAKKWVNRMLDDCCGEKNEIDRFN